MSPNASPRARSPRTAYRAPRPKRGTPEETRDRLVAAAAELFNQNGYDGTDTNRIAREAGYSPGLFYKHFADKRAIFIAVYDAWVAEEWRAVETLLAQPSVDTPRELVATIVTLHRRWRGFRRSLRSLAGRDPTIKRAHLKGRKRQLATMARLREEGRISHAGDPAHDLLLLYTLERIADAHAEREIDTLGIDPTALLAVLEDLVRDALT